jgi:hypothetical protein
MNTSRISVRVTRKLRSEIRKRAKATQKNEAELIREALEKEFQSPANQQSCFDVASKLGIIASIPDAPADLSTNPKYMEGFGAGDK